MSEAAKPSAGAPALLPWPQVDHAAFGEIERRPVSRVQQFVAANLARNWALIPHVTHHDEADITALESFRQRYAAETGLKLTPLPFLVKAAVAALKALPQFNASLEADGKTLVLKKYWHIGVAVDTPGGLLVPVIRDADQKRLAQIATELAAVSEKARGKGLSMAEMSGGCFSISSLGGIGGTAFTPIINAPEVAILGVTKAARRPSEVEGGLEWRTLLPLSLSYDHRVINGADAARFCRKLAEVLARPEGLAT